MFKPARTDRHPRVRAIMAHLERLLASDAPAYEATCGDLVEMSLLDFVHAVDMRAWSQDAIRAVARAILTNCPNADLEAFAEWGERHTHVDRLERWEVEGRYRRLTGATLDGDRDLNYAALLRAQQGPVSEEETNAFAPASERAHAPSTEVVQ